LQAYSKSNSSAFQPDTIKQTESGPPILDNYQYKDFKYNSHYWILKFLSQGPGPLRILDVGTATGYLGAILKEKHHSLVGIESHGPFTAQARRHYEQFHETNIETFDFPYREEFDYILFADVLEHLRNPEQVLKRALPCLKRHGRIIISVPNIANIVMRLNIFLGRFEYAERGILDKTHLRFFTLASLKRMVSETGLWVIDIVATPLPIQLVIAATDHRLFKPLHELHYTIVRSWKSLFAYQFVLTASCIEKPAGKITKSDECHSRHPFSLSPP
jgi:2-polyprenyl-3-methyl-5-hydroxy-6-metoxy-1,4-benzoquinol methylase